MEEKIKLSNGIEIPNIGLGTWLIPNDVAEEAVKEALNMGYRHIDTAQVYLNERTVGSGVRKSGIPREEIFVNSKVGAEFKTYKEAAESIDETLKKMELEYLDMMLIHSPQPWTEVNKSDNRYIEGNREAWRALEDAYKAGKLKAIGVSNFLKGDIESLWESAKIKPMVNQILCHISNTPFELIDYCKEKGIVVESYSPVGHGEMFKNLEVAKLAKKYGVSVPRLCIRYCLQLGTVVLPKAIKPAHMKENLDVNFEISDEDMYALKNIERIKDYGEHKHFAIYGGVSK